MKTIFEKSVPGRLGVKPSKSDVPETIHLKKDLLRKKSAKLPEMSSSAAQRGGAWRYLGPVSRMYSPRITPCELLIRLSSKPDHR